MPTRGPRRHPSPAEEVEVNRCPISFSGEKGLDHFPRAPPPPRPPPRPPPPDSTHGKRLRSLCHGCGEGRFCGRGGGDGGSCRGRERRLNPKRLRPSAHCPAAPPSSRSRRSRRLKIRGPGYRDRVGESRGGGGRFGHGAAAGGSSWGRSSPIARSRPRAPPPHPAQPACHGPLESENLLPGVSMPVVILGIRRGGGGGEGGPGDRGPAVCASGEDRASTSHAPSP